MTVYYNDNEGYVCAWLEKLIDVGAIPKGDVDDRSIEDVRPQDLEGYHQCHFFAGIGGWPHALELAGWPADRPVWTASCPCQPVSCAGKRKGHEDERHLWPELYRLVRELRPVTLFGEQVASSDGLEWLDGVCLDLEELGYAVAACDLPAACVGAPHIRQRLWWVADAVPTGRAEGRAKSGRRSTAGNGSSGRLADADGRNARPEGLQRSGQHRQQQENGGTGGLAEPKRQRARARKPGIEGRTGQRGNRPAIDGEAGWLADADVEGRQGQSQPMLGPSREGPWSDYILVPCRDGKARRIEPGTTPLADGIPQRVGKLRAYGNAIVPQVAAKFVRAYMETARIRQEAQT